jgi:hypothetical protein
MTNDEIIGMLYDESVPLVVLASTVQTALTDRDNWKATSELLHAVMTDLNIQPSGPLDSWYEQGRNKVESDKINSGKIC